VERKGGGDEEREADPLGGAETEPDEPFLLVTPEEFEEEAGQGVEGEIEGGDGSVAVGTPVRDIEGKVNEEIGGCFEGLYGKEGMGIRRRWGEGVKIFDLIPPGGGTCRIDHGKWAVVRKTVTATVEKAADTSEGVAEGEGGERKIEKVPRRYAASLCQPPDCEGRAEETAVKDETALIYPDNLDGVGQQFAGIGEHVGEPGAGNASDKNPKDQVGNEGRIASFPPAEEGQVKESGGESERHENAVPMNGTAKHFATDRIGHDHARQNNARSSRIQGPFLSWRVSGSS